LKGRIIALLDRCIESIHVDMQDFSCAFDHGCASSGSRLCKIWFAACPDAILGRVGTRASGPHLTTVLIRSHPLPRDAFHPIASGAPRWIQGSVSTVAIARWLSGARPCLKRKNHNARSAG
jgi:hypothetical protein